MSESGLPTLSSFSYAGSRVERLDYGNGLRAQYTYAGLAGVPNAPGDFSWAEVSRIRHAAAAGSPLVVEYACYRYQACESPDWEQTEAYAFCLALEQSPIKRSTSAGR